MGRAFFIKQKTMSQTTSQDTSQQVQNNGGLWGSIVGTVGDLATGFNYQQQENQIELARINAQAQMAQNESNGIDRKYLYIGGGIVVLVILVMLFKK